MHRHADRSEKRGLKVQGADAGLRGDLLKREAASVRKMIFDVGKRLPQPVSAEAARLFGGFGARPRDVSSCGSRIWKRMRSSRRRGSSS